MNQISILKINPEKIAEEIINFIRITVKKAGFGRVVIGLSGGIDSSAVFSLAVKALRAENVYGVMMPYGDWNKEALEEIEELAKTLKFPQKKILAINIKPFCEPVFANLGGANQLRKGNIMVRMRMIVLYDMAKKYNALVLGTENKSEHFLSYFTRFGDEASDIEPIKHLYKTQIYKLAEYLKVPEPILTKAPSAGLWSGQTDEGQFGFTYATADQILYGLYDRKLTVAQLIKQGFKKQNAEKVKTWVETNWFKHELPIVYPSR